MPDGSGIDVLVAAKERSPATEVIVMTAHSTVEAAIDAMRRGAYDFVTKPFSPAEIAALAQKALEKSSIVAENQRLRAQLERLEPTARESLGTSPAMQRVAELVEKVAPTQDHRAHHRRERHRQGARRARCSTSGATARAKPFVVVNCGALPEALMESELFGHEKGAFTGAAARALGLFREADGGTLLLDEVGELPASLQVKLLRVLQERQGARRRRRRAEVPIDVRVLAATNRDVEADVRERKFRQDLYYRLNVIRIELPPLRDRPGDVSRLAERFVRRFAARARQGRPRPHRRRAPRARRLRLPRQRARAREHDGARRRPRLRPGDRPRRPARRTVAGLSASPAPLLADLPPEGCTLDDVLGEVERRLILQALSPHRRRPQGRGQAARRHLPLVPLPPGEARPRAGGGRRRRGLT